MVLFPGCPCCGCTPCARCLYPCLSVTFSGFAGDPEAECDECTNLNGTYVLNRGEGVRPEITLTVTATTGSGATVTPTVEYDKTTGGYTITKVTVNKSGDGYSSDAAITTSIDGGLIGCGDEPEFEVELERSVPTLTLSVAAEVPGREPAGSGAVLQPVFVPVATDPGAETWGLDSVTVTNGGGDYEDGELIEYEVTKGTEVSYLEASIRIDHAQPVIDEVTVDSAGGGGASFSVTWDVEQDLYDFYNPLGYGDFWYIDSVTITSAGTGYSVNDEVRYTLSGTHRLAPGQIASAPYFLARVATVGGSGEILTLDFAPPESSHFKTDGIIQSVFVDTPGEFFAAGVKSVTVLDGGTIWPDSACTYTLCGPTECLYDGEPKCRKISLEAAADGFHLTVQLGEDPPLLEATLPPEGNSCGDLTFDGEAITQTGCETAGTIAVVAAECDGPPDADSCCGGEGGCPNVEGCNLVVVLDYPGAPQEYSNEPIGELGGDCLLSGEIEDIPIESGGDITWNLTVGTDGNGNPVPQNITIVRTVDSPDNDQSCDDGITDCVPVLFTIDCNPLP